MLSKMRLAQILIMLSLLIGLFIWRTVSVTTSETPKEEENKALVIENSYLCDFVSPCIYGTSLGDFSLSIEGNKIIPEQAFNLILESNQKGWKVNQAKILGKDVFMGKVPVTFSSVSKVGNVFQATAKSMIGACTDDQLLWRLEVQIESNGKIFPLYYDFTISK
ncbi:hypothetical protein [Psychromonas aquatilis]|uniref:Uncharacterized protein n=1 Tax=Psychromonas aquatilis TaxID=2005072 RepID=A0ABU9GTH7_9GAMM